MLFLPFLIRMVSDYLPFNVNSFFEYFDYRKSNILFLDFFLPAFKTFFSINPFSASIILFNKFNEHGFYSIIYGIIYFISSFHIIYTVILFFKNKIYESYINKFILSFILIYTLPYLTFFNGLIGLRLSSIFYLLIFIITYPKDEK